MDAVTDNSQAATSEQVQSELPGVTSEGSGEQNKSEGVNWEKRYSDSSAEAKRLFEGKAKAEAELAALKSSSLKSDTEGSQVPQFPSEVQVVNHLVNNFEFTEKQAKFMHDRDKAFFEQQNQLIVQNKALANLVRYKTDQFEKGFSSLDPLAKEAAEFFNDVPEINALSATEKTDRYRKIMEKKGMKISGRDTSAAKSAAGGSVGGSSGLLQGSGSSQNETIAKSLGWSTKAFEEYANVSTETDHKAWAKRHNIKV